jgi:prepilin-type N-terminal cleavage/methylation domain-containing protein
MKKNGFALVEVLIALSILSITLMSVYSAVGASTTILSGSGNRTKAMLIAKNKLNEFIASGLRGPDLNSEPVDGYPDFTYSRGSEKYENFLFPTLAAKKYTITVNWMENKARRTYKISYVNPLK